VAADGAVAIGSEPGARAPHGQDAVRSVRAARPRHRLSARSRSPCVARCTAAGQLTPAGAAGAVYSPMGRTFSARGPLGPWPSE
jgi:hypothetical protein